MIKAVVFGASGYAGEELLRWLTRHPKIEVTAAVARSLAGSRVQDIYSDIESDLVFCDDQQEVFVEADVVFFATPHATAHQYAQQCLQADTKVIDLSADFRLQDVDIWQEYYDTKHQSPELIPQAVYGLAEYNRNAIVGADLIACPGCYPTSIILAMLPLLKMDMVLDRVSAVSISGISGAGRKIAEGDLQENIKENIYSYKVDKHRHYPEIVQTLSNIAQRPIDICFVPQLVPVFRGMHSTVIIPKIQDSAQDLWQIFTNFYQNESFVEVLPQQDCPQTKNVIHTNKAQLAIYDKGTHYVILSVIDNLAKGASTQAIQNMNICFGWDEKLGLDA